MKNKRKVLFYVQDNRGIHPRTIENTSLTIPLSSALKLASASDMHSNVNNFAKKISFFDYYSWDLKKLGSDCLVSEVPKPGIVLAICQSDFDDTYYEAQILRFKAENNEDETQQKLLYSFTNCQNDFSPFTYHVFLSYSNKDLKLASEIHSELMGNRIRCFMSAKDIDTGIVWEQAIREALLKSKVVILLLTPNSLDSKWVMCEAGACWVIEKPLLPATMFVDIANLPEPIRRYQAIPIETQEGKVSFFNDIRSIINS